MSRKIFAAFIIAPQFIGGIAGTTRASDKLDVDNGVKIGFPGGKVEAGETPAEAAVREAKEEGFQLELVSKEPVHIATVQGKTVAWFAGRNPVKLQDFKEEGRIKPVFCNFPDFRGFGNEEAIEKFLDKYLTRCEICTQHIISYLGDMC